MNFKNSLKAALCSILFVLLTSCDTEEPMGFAPACPKIDVLPDASEQANWADNQTAELAHLKNTLSLITMNGTCEYKRRLRDSDPFITRVALSPTFTLTGGAAQSDGNIQEQNKTVDIPYFVAIMRNGKVLDKKVFHYSTPSEPEGQSRLVETPIRYIDVPTGADPQESAYKLVIGMQLSEQQLQYNRSHPKHITFRKKSSGTKASFGIL